jgi:hypothetical protein
MVKVTSVDVKKSWQRVNTMAIGEFFVGRNTGHLWLKLDDLDGESYAMDLNEDSGSLLLVPTAEGRVVDIEEITYRA